MSEPMPITEQNIEKLHDSPLCKVCLAQSRILLRANFRHVSGHYDSPRKGKNGSFLAIFPHRPQVIR